jgi:hypothetical protein
MESETKEKVHFESKVSKPISVPVFFLNFIIEHHQLREGNGCGHYRLLTNNDKKARPPLRIILT